MFREPIFDKIKLPAIAAILALLLGLTAFAEVVDPGQAGSIEVTLRSEETGKAISGGSITLYQVGKVAVDDWNYSFELTDGFVESGFSLDDLKPDGDPELAKKFADYVNDYPAESKNAVIDIDGRAVFTGLENGLYLCVQTEASQGYYPVNPFLVSIPRYDADTERYEYNVDATPKTEPAQKETPGETDPEETRPSETSPHSGGGGGSGSGSHSPGMSSGGPGVGEGEPDTGSTVWELLPLPQTGQGRAMLAAVVIMIIAGAAMIVALSIKRKG